MVRVAVTLDSAGKKQEAAAAYERFAAAYPRDARAAGALRNAAITYDEANNAEAAARVYGAIAARSANTAAGDSATARRIVLLQQMGDSATASREFARLCDRRGTQESVREACAGRAAERAEMRAAALFAEGVALWPEYQAARFTFSSAAQLSKAGVQRAQAEKQRLGRRMTDIFKRVIATKNARYASAATYYLGMTEWEYGNFLKNVELPEALSAEERAAAEQGVAGLAQGHYDAAQNVWRELTQSAAAASPPITNEWITRAAEALAGNVPETPPTSSLPKRVLEEVAN
jgi:hypothetical protein